MTTPSEIYADMDLRDQSQGLWECVPFTIHPDSPRYIRADIADAVVQAAVAKAVDAERDRAQSLVWTLGHEIRAAMLVDEDNEQTVLDMVKATASAIAGGGDE